MSVLSAKCGLHFWNLIVIKETTGIHYEDVKAPPFCIGVITNVSPV